MKINHFLCARLTTNLTLLVFFLFALGVILWTSDEFLDWDLLPNWIDRYAQLIIVVVGIFAFLLVVSSLLCSFMVLTEFAAQKLGIQRKEFQILTRKRLIIFTTVIVLALVTFFTLHKIDEYREESRVAKNRLVFQEKLTQRTKALEKALSHIVTLFPETVLQAIENNSMMEKHKYLELTKLLSAISASLPKMPEVSLLIPASHPYQYSKIWVIGEPESYDRRGNIDKFYGHKLHQLFFTQLPNKLEREVVEGLFKENSQPLKVRIKGQIINNTRPSAWGLLKLNGKVISLIALEDIIIGYERVSRDIFHVGPTKLISN